MSGRENFKSSEVDDISRRIYSSAAGAIRRLEGYTYTPAHKEYSASQKDEQDPVVDILHVSHIHHRELDALREAGVKKDATVVALGHADGSELLLWLTKYKHAGRILGVNLDPIADFGLHWAKELSHTPVDLSSLHKAPEEIDRNLADINFERLKRGEKLLTSSQISFLESDAGKTELPDNCADVVTANMLLYHVRDWPSIIREMVRIAKYDAVVAISTRDVENYARMWGDMSPIGEYLGAQEVPSSFYRHFGIRELIQVMREYFTPLSEHDYDQEENINWPASRLDNLLEIYMEQATLFVYNPARPATPPYTHERTHPSPAEMKDALRHIVLPRMCREIKATEIRNDQREIIREGYVTDYASQHFRLGRNNKWKTPDGRLILQDT